MPKLLTASRAARLVGVTRGAIQKKILNDELETFEGMVTVSALLRAYPDVQLEDDSTLERVKRIKAVSTPESREVIGLPPPEVLASRLSCMSQELVNAKIELGAYTDFMQQIEAKLADVGNSVDENMREQLSQLGLWFKHELANRPQMPKRTAELLAKDTFLRMIAAQVKVIPSGHDFFVEGTDSILEAALRAGLNLNYGCSDYSCGRCKVRVVSGDVLKIHDYRYALSQTELNLGYMLMCAYTAVTDLTLEAAEADKSTHIPPQNLTCQARQTTCLNDDLMILHLQTTEQHTLRFMAGQSVTLSLETGEQARYSIASCPCDGKNLQFHLQRLDSDALSLRLFKGLSPDQMLNLSGPHGEFVLHHHQQDPLLFIAESVGFAPIKSLIEHAVSMDVAEHFQLHWFAENSAGHYMNNLCRSWRDALDNFDYQAIEADTDSWASALQEIQRNQVDLEKIQIYIAGSAAFLECAVAVFEAVGKTCYTQVVE